MTTENMIEITGANLVEVVKAVYDLSRPQGMGFLHFDSAPLTDEEAKSLIAFTNPRVPVDLDYVKGRACKFFVRREEDGTLWIQNSWYDHSDHDLQDLLKRIGK